MKLEKLKYFIEIDIFINMLKINKKNETFYDMIKKGNEK